MVADGPACDPVAQPLTCGCVSWNGDIRPVQRRASACLRHSGSAVPGGVVTVAAAAGEAVSGWR